MPSTRDIRSNSDGSSSVEFAILAPIFLLLIFGMIAYGIYFGAAHAVQQLSADAARISIAGISNAERDALVKNYIRTNTKDYVLLDPSRLTYQVGESKTDPNQYLVAISYDASSLPIWDIYPPLPLPSKTIAFTSTIRKGGR